MSTNCISCVVNERTGNDLLCDRCRAAERLESLTAGWQVVGKRTRDDICILLAERETYLQSIQEMREFVKDYHFLRCSCRMSNVNGGMAYIVKGIGDNLTPSRIRSLRLERENKEKPE